MGGNRSIHGRTTREKCNKFSPRGTCIRQPIVQEGVESTYNIDVSINFLNDIEEFQALIQELKNQSLMTARRLEERMATQTKL